MKGVKVVHKLLGEGSVQSLKNDMLTVQFPEKEMTFIFPDCFQNVLSTDDKDMSAFVKMAINNRALEKKLVEKKGLKNRIYQTRKEIPRWSTPKKTIAKKEPVKQTDNSIKENNQVAKSSKSPITKTVSEIPRKLPQKPTVTKQANSFNKYSKTLVRYKGINCFVYRGEIKKDTITINPIELKDNKELCRYIYKNDLVFSLEENKVKCIGIVSTSKLTDDNTYNYKLNIIPMIEEVKLNNNYDKFLTHLTKTEYTNLLYTIRKVCPYISSIEGIKELM